MIVLDASAAVLALLADGDARRLVATEHVTAPHHIDVEVAHAIRGHVRRGIIAADDGGLAIRTWAKLGIRRMAVVSVLERVWELRDNLSAYDAAYVAVAETLGCHLVTADGRLARAPGIRCTLTVVSR